ncbi:DUF1295 domain-containing protein [Streptomyces sp. NPDC046215]
MESSLEGWGTVGFALVLVVGFVGVLFAGSLLLPGRVHAGSPLGDGSRESYRLNGFLLFGLALAATAAVWWVRPDALGFVADHSPALFVAANVLAFAVAGALYAVGRRRGAGAGAGRGAAAVVREWFLGVELNPKLAGVDLKLFSYRPSLIGLFLVNVSFAAAQYAERGELGGRMVLYQVMFLLYVANYFQFEYGMVHTWDIKAERFGWMLVWGDFVLVPFFYSLPGRVLRDVESPLPWWQAALSIALFAAGFWMFRGANAQKHRFKEDARAVIWGRPARALGGRLLVSGFWGVGRKLNYTGELMMYTAWTMLCGTASLLPYAVPVFLAALFVHRALRDDRRCRAKYGRLWSAYCRTATFRMVPFDSPRSGGVRGARLPRQERAAVGFLVFSLVMAFTLELYFVTAWRTIDQHQDVFARLFRVYGMGDSTYYGQGDVALPFALETINVFLTQGLNIALIVAIVRGLPWRYPLQLAVSSYVAYSVLLYFWHAHAGGYPAMPVHSPLAFFVFYAPNLPWFLGNLWMAGSAFRAMTARLGPARAAGEPSPSAAAGVPAAAGVITGRGKRSEAAPRPAAEEPRPSGR